MVVEPGERIVSVCTVTPKRLWRGGKEQSWGEIGDTFTDAAFLRQGMFSALVNASRTRAQAAGFKIIYGLPNDNSLPGYVSKLNFQIKADLVLDTFSAILSTRALAARTLLAKVPGVRALLTAAPMIVASRGLAGIVSRWRMSPGVRISVSIERTFGAAYDELWTTVRGHLPNAQVRDARYLRWRFEQNPFPFVVLGARAAGRLVGYAATLTLNRDVHGGFAHTILSDWIYDPEVDGVTEALLGGTMRYAIDQKADVLSAMVSRSSPLRLPFNRLGFLHRPRQAPVIVHQNEEGLALLDDPSPWHFTWSDTDGF